MESNTKLSFFKSARNPGHRGQNVIFCISLVLAMMVLFPLMGHAFEGSLEKDVQKDLEQGQAIVETIQKKLQTGSSVSAEIAQLKKSVENIKISNLLMEERFKLREEKVKSLGAKAVDRHEAMVKGYRKALKEYLILIDGLPSRSQESEVRSQERVEKIKALLDKLLVKKHRPIIGSLPYKHLNYPAIEPSTAPAITPAYKGGNKIVSPDDTKSTPEAPISKEIAALAQSLNWQPVAIYEHVKNTIETEWYWGCQKGAEETLRQKSGNDCDQALLLSSLLKASGFPTRLVRGNIQFFASNDKPIERIKNLIGIDDPAKMAEFFQKAGIPNKPIIAGGKIANFQIEHIWIESLIPMANYRGAVTDEHGKTWIGLDTSIKVKGYEYNQPQDIFENAALSSQLSAIRDEYLGLDLNSQPSTTQPATPLEYLQSFINSELQTQNSPLAYVDFQRTKVLLPEVMNILPSSTQFTLIKATNEYTSLPDELVHKVKLSAVSNQPSANIDKLFEITLSLYQLSNQQVAITYEPETVEDQEIIDSYGGLDNTPSYLIRLRPVLKINGERIVVATDGLPMGADYTLTIELYSPSITEGAAPVETVTNTMITGNLTVIGIAAGKAVMTPSPLAGEGGGEGEKDAERLLFESAQHYIDRENQAEDELASLFHLSITRPLPTVVTLAGMIDVTYLLDMPHGFTWKGVYVDADLRRVEAVVSTQQSATGGQLTAESSERVKLFMQLSSLQGSVLENRIFEDDFKVESISTAKLFQLINQQSANSYQLLTIDKTNIDAILPTLSYDDSIKEDITNSVNQNYTIKIPESELTYHDWNGTGYMKENIETGESGWMLSGEIAGGNTVDAEWLNNLYLQQTLSTPYTGPVNHDPLAGVRIFKIPVTDKQDPKIVGTALSTPFAVAVLDGIDQSVVGATVTFRIIAGGGKIQCLNETGSPIGQPSETSCDAPTSITGIAKATLMLGVKTDANPDYMKLDASDENYTRIGLNLVTASAASSSGSISLNAPFEAYGKPDVPTKIEKVYPLNPVYVLVNNPGGSLLSKITDTHGNPVSNVSITFKTEAAESNNPATDPLPAAYQNLGLYSRETCTNPYPVAGDCAISASLTLTTHYYGEQVETILGNTLNTHYKVTVSSPGVQDVAFDLYSQGGRSSAGTYVPSVLMVWNLGIVNEQGQPVNASKVGTDLKAPLAAKMFLLQDEYDVQSELCTRQDSSGNTVTYTGYTVTSQGTFTIKPITNGTVTFTSLQGSGTAAQTQNIGNGLYQAAYRTGETPAQNTIEANGSATVTVPQIYGRDVPRTRCLESPVIDRTVTLQHGECALFSPATNELAGVYATDMKPTYTAYGVDTQLAVEPAVILLDELGFSTIDTKFTYTILPPEYNALRADLDFYKTGQSNAETWDSYVVADKTQGQGQVIFVAGTPYDSTQLYKAQVVLNKGTDVEIRGDKQPLTLITSANLGHSFGLERAYHLSQFDDPIPGILSSDHTDTYEIFDFHLGTASDVKAKFLNRDGDELGVIVPQTSLAAGDYNFVVDYDMAEQAGINPLSASNFYVLLQITPQNGTAVQVMLHPGRMYQRTDGKMLGQTLVHDVLLQDGSLNLSRQDLSLKGRGPQLVFSRSYNNQPSAKGFKPLGEGWSHSLDMKLRMLGAESSGAGFVPLWLSQHRGMFYSPADAPPAFGALVVVAVNGTVFKKNGAVWYSERGHHGTLTETVSLAGTTYRYTAKDGTRYTYLYQGGTEASVQQIEDRNGNVMQFTYDVYGKLVSVKDAADRQLVFAYAQSPYTSGFESRLMKVTGPDGIELEFTYDVNGYLASAKRADRIEKYEYQLKPSVLGALDEYAIVKATDANNHVYAYEYHAAFEINPFMQNFIKVLKSQDVVKKVVYPDNSVASFSYDVQTENKRIVTDLRGNNTVYTLNHYGNPKKIEEPQGKVTLMTWSIDQGLTDNVMTSMTDARGNTTAYQYDAKGNIAAETDPYNHTSTTTWNQQFSLPESRTDRNGKTQSWQYDSTNGNLISHTDGDNKQTTYTYFGTGELKTVLDPRGNTTSYTYDSYGNPNTVTGQEGSVTDYGYDIRGRRTSIKDPNGRTTSYTYDALDYPATIVHPVVSGYSLPAGSSAIQSFIYDPTGNLLSETNRNGLTLTYAYTARNQVASVARSTDGAKSFTYDSNGNLLTETDWMGTAISHTYNALNQRDSTTNRLSFPMSMGYDLVGNLTSVTDYEGKVTTYVYDNLNRQTDIYQPALNGQQSGHIVKTYFNEADRKTNLKTETDQEGNTTSYEYNGRYLPIKRTNALNDEYIWAYDDSGNLATETDEEGNATTYDYDGQNRRIAMHRTLSGRDVKTQYSYDLNGNRTHVIDPLTHDTETKYDTWNRPWQVIDADSFTTKTEYDGEGNPVKTTDGNSHFRSMVRDVEGRVLTATDAEGNSTTYAYDLNGNVKTVIDALGTVTQTVYDAEDRPTTITEAAGTNDERSKAVLARDKMGNPLQVRDYNGNVTRTEYNGLYLTAKVTDPASHYSETQYFKTGKVKSVKNRRGYVTQYEYDALIREKKVTDPLAKTIETTYDKIGNVKTSKDKRGIIAEKFYDELYRPVRTERAGVRLVTNEYDDAGNKTATIDANSNRTGYAYNNRNLLKTTTYADSTTEKRTYDGVGNVLTSTNEENKVTTFTYDKENRQTSVEFAGEKTQKAYDAVGSNISITKPLGNKRTMAYDALRRLISVTDDPIGLSLTTVYQYDANGNMRHQYDVRGNHVEFTYDAQNRKTQHIQYKAANNLVTSYTSYDEEGNLTGLSDPKSQSFTYGYDELNRRTDENYPNVVTPYLTLSRVHSDYDANNNITGIIETKATTTGSTITDTTVNTYDNFDRLWTNTQRGVTITYGYDDNGNRTLVSSPTGSTGYTYNSRNRIETAIDGDLVTSFTYYPDGKKDTVTYPNGTDVKYTYHPTNRVKTVVNKKTVGIIISSYAYVYDSNGNRTNQTEVQDGTTETTSYLYDTVDRLTSFTINGQSTTLNEYTFEGYNRKTEKVTQNGAVTASKTYNYDETDWLSRITDNTDPANVRTISYAYDRNGNTMLKIDSLLPDQNIGFTYDAGNRLIQTKRGAPGADSVVGLYDYNAEGLRIRHRFSDRGDVDYFYDGRSVIDEYDASDNSFMVHYTYADRLLSLASGNGLQYYHHDGLGSTVNLTDTSGITQVSYNVDPWGHIRRQAGYSINRHMFTDKEHDLNTGLVYFGARYYDSDTARFITQDSYLGEPGTPPSLHRYLYAYGNPTVYEDSDGHSATVGGAIIGYLWGVEQMFQGMYDDLSEGKYRSTTEYLSIIGQNVVAGTEIGASIDVAAMSGGWALPASLAIGGAGFETLTTDGRAVGSATELTKLQTRGAAKGLLLGGALSKAAPYLSRAISKVPGGQKLLEKAGSLSEAALRGISNVGENALADITGAATSRTGQEVVQRAAGEVTSEVKPRLSMENMKGDPATAVAKVENIADSGVSSRAAEPYQLRQNFHYTDADAANRAIGGEPQYRPGTLTVEFQTGTKEQYVRVYTEGFNKPQGRWMMRAEDIAGLTPEQIQQKFALPQVPTHVVDAEVPSNFRLRMGEAGANKFAPSGGNGIQAQTIDDYEVIKFNNPRPLP